MAGAQKTKPCKTIIHNKLYDLLYVDCEYSYYSTFLFRNLANCTRLKGFKWATMLR